MSTEVREFMEENDDFGETYVPRKYALDLKPIGKKTARHKRQLSAYYMTEENKKRNRERATP